jgi:3-isopropylmalate/(R)-2-methylmalate dehydratase small subunit
VFADDRLQAQGTHPFDQPPFQGANILVVNANFGCGSSREHAPQALMRWGIQALVGESFAEIFFGNCVSLGIPCLTAPVAAIAELQTTLEANPEIPMTVDLNALTLSAGDQVIPISLGAGVRDACGQLVAQQEQVQVVATRLPYLAWA